MKFTIIKSGLACFSGIFALGTPSNIHGTTISYRFVKFGAFVNSVTILTLRDLTLVRGLFSARARHARCQPHHPPKPGKSALGTRLARCCWEKTVFHSDDSRETSF